MIEAVTDTLKAALGRIERIEERIANLEQVTGIARPTCTNTVSMVVPCDES